MQPLGHVSAEPEADVGSLVSGRRDGMGQQLRSLAHPGWPYTGTQWAWRGFEAAVEDNGMPTLHDWRDFAAYQKLNLGPDLP